MWECTTIIGKPTVVAHVALHELGTDILAKLSIRRLVPNMIIASNTRNELTVFFHYAAALLVYLVRGRSHPPEVVDPIAERVAV
jgi:hypothetical protein